jgi:bifunctional non-homologous end joining protein LigD
MTTVYSRRENVLNQRFPYIATALRDLPNETLIDGELVALGLGGRPDFNLLQNFRSAESRIVYYALDILVQEGQRLAGLNTFSSTQGSEDGNSRCNLPHPTGYPVL